MLAIVQAARRFGALAITYAEAGVAADERRAGDRRARARPAARHRRWSCGPGTSSNATGVWVDALQNLEQPGRVAAIQPSKGVHVVVPRDRLPLLDASVLLPSKQGDGRSMFAIPWGNQTILGTTDTPYDGELDELSLTSRRPRLRPDRRQRRLQAATWSSTTCSARGPESARWCKQEGSESMSDISRRHTLVEGSGGMLTITGGKLTTYRRMAKDVVDRIVDKDDLKARCRTDEIPLSGTRPVDVLEAESTATAADARAAGRRSRSRWCGSAGRPPAHVLSLVKADPSLGELLSPWSPHIAAEVVHAVRSEGAATLDDVFSRRMRLSLRSKDAALPAAPLAAALLARELALRRRVGARSGGCLRRRRPAGTRSPRPAAGQLTLE